MVEWRKAISVFVALLVATATVGADMVPLTSLDAGYRPSPQTCIPTDPRLPGPSNPYAGFAGMADLGSLPVGFPTQPNAEAGPTSETKPAQILTDRQNSLHLCLYALLSLGLCRSAPFVKKLHLGSLPDWYHAGGPFQVGHSHAIAPDCLSPAAVYCFIQPGYTAEDRLPQYYWGIIASLLQKTQLTPGGLASRGPPTLS
jgi:hypothetical protein